MGNRSGREALRGAEVQTLYLIAQNLTAGQWTELLKGPVESAASQGNRDLAKKLVEAGADAMGDQSVRGEALREVEVETLDLIFVSITSEEWAKLLNGPLERAVDQGNRDLAQKLVKAGAEIGYALHAAVRGGQRDVVRDLLDSGASINAKHTASTWEGYTPLHVAAQQGKPEMVKLLMLRGADKYALDDRGWTPLHAAAYFCSVAAAAALLAGGVDVNIRYGQMERSVMHIAAEKGHGAILRTAIEHGADVNAADADQYTALHHAAEHNNVEAIDVLVDAGANIEARSDDSETPLFSAAFCLNLEAVAVIIKHGADVNAQNNFLETALYSAVARAVNAGTREAVEVVDLLLRSGADETITDRNGKTAADVMGKYTPRGYKLRQGIVRRLLANAPADRTWRRRGYLVLCRAHPDKLHQARDSGTTHADTAPGTSSVTRSDVSGYNEPVPGSTTHGERIGGDWISVVDHVLGLQEEDIFRTIVEYL